MHITAFFVLTASLWGSFGSCETRFISPPDWEDDKRNRGDPERNRRYTVGEKVPVDWETDLKIKDYRLLLCQVFGSNYLYVTLDRSKTSWEAEYHARDGMEDGEDSLYYFVVSDPGMKTSFADSLYINVTAPSKAETRTVTAPPNTVTISQSRPIETKTESTTTITRTEETVLPTEQQESESTSGLSKGEVAGAAVGGVVGGFLIFGAFGWVLWRRIAGRKSEPVDTAAVQYQAQVVETKAELPGDNRLHPTEYARSPTGVYEAP